MDTGAEPVGEKMKKRYNKEKRVRNEKQHNKRKCGKRGPENLDLFLRNITTYYDAANDIMYFTVKRKLQNIKHAQKMNRTFRDKGHIALRFFD